VYSNTPVEIVSLNRRLKVNLQLIFDYVVYVFLQRNLFIILLWLMHMLAYLKSTAISLVRVCCSFRCKCYVEICKCYAFYLVWIHSFADLLVCLTRDAEFSFSLDFDCDSSVKKFGTPDSD